ncbi:MAG TPA: flagellar export chaperone FliS [Bacilli bacterium]|nr:flagellar export chaperone FliS [Bacilli bacterium]
MNNVYQSYNNVSVMTASPGELTLMLYNGAIRFLKQSKAAMEKHESQPAREFLNKGQAIVLELMATLNMDIAIAQELYQQYDFMNRHLLQASIKREPSTVQDVIELLEELRDAWNGVLKATRGQAVGMGN